MKEINTETLSDFFKNRPSIRTVEEEAGIPQGYLNRIIKGEQPLTEATKAKLLPILKKYKF